MSHPTEEWRGRAQRVAREAVDPVAEEIDRTDRMVDSIRGALARAGLTGLGIPAEWGGSGGRATDVVAVLEELAASSAAVATELAVHLSVAAAPIAEWGTAEQKRLWLPPLAEGRWLGAFALTEPGSGSDAGGLRTRYRAVDGGWELEGSKMFITNGASADLVLLFGTRDPALGHAGISAFVVPRGTAGFSIAQRLDKLGLRGSETTEIVLRSVRLGTEARLGPEGEGLKIALKALSGGRVGIAACALGVARRAYEEMVRAARADPEDWKRSAVARAYTDLSAARALVEHAAAEKDAGRPFIEAASAAKLFASHAALRIAHVGFEVAGGEARRRGSPAERLLRDARVFPIVEGTTEIQELILGRAILGPSAGSSPSASASNA